MEKRRYSQVELAKTTGMSQSFISRVLHGERLATSDFCVKIALALGEPPDKLLRLAGILPTSPASDDDPTLVELQDLVKNLSLSQRKEALRYLRYLYHSGHEER
jgi:transcriptional regulator with XRE-family HTH domain